MAAPEIILTAENVSLKTGGTGILNNIHLTVRKGEQWAIVGQSGSGKTTLAHALVGKIFYTGTITWHFPAGIAAANKIILIEQQHRFKNLSNTSDFYYQQRFNSSDADNSITVLEALKEYNIGNGEENLQKWIDLLQLSPLLQEPLIQLSNGENKRLQLAEALLSEPAILIMDNPFVGLDVAGRKTLQTILNAITANGIHLLLITNPLELPACISNIAVLQNGSLQSYNRQKYDLIEKSSDKKNAYVLSEEQLKRIYTSSDADFSTVIKMINVSVQYGDKKILESINWEVKRGECWNVSGPNGAGKSTLLSLITADNPQAYANEIYLFNKRKGKGESIWDIKKRIGYVSPELHLFFGQQNNCFEVIASGLFDTIGLFRQLSSIDEEKVNVWIDILQLQKVKIKLLSHLPLGQQRMVLLARALIKNPPLLILDEPCQGLDDEQAAYFKNLIDHLCRHFNSTLLYVSHYEKDIPSCVDKYMRLVNGSQIAEPHRT